MESKSTSCLCWRQITHEQLTVWIHTLTPLDSVTGHGYDMGVATGLGRAEYEQ